MGHAVVTITPRVSYSMFGRFLLALHAMTTKHTNWRCESVELPGRSTKVYAVCQCGWRCHLLTIRLVIGPLVTQGGL